MDKLNAKVFILRWASRGMQVTFLLQHRVVDIFPYTSFSAKAKIIEIEIEMFINCNLQAELASKKSWGIWGYLFLRCQLVAVWSKMKVVRVLAPGFPGCSWTSVIFSQRIWQWYDEIGRIVKSCDVKSSEMSKFCMWTKIIKGEVDTGTGTQDLFHKAIFDDLFSQCSRSPQHLRRPRTATIAPTCGRGPTVMSVDIG